jgi:MFS family permease
MSEPLTQSSLRSYMYYQLQSFDRSLPASTIAWQAGALASAFTFAQFCTAILWGKLADSEYCGRKRVLLIGLMGTGISAIGYGFSGTFAMALAFRFLGGILNGNVGVMRSMVSEMIREKK